ncbi:MAG: metallophosphoesterase [Ignavibacteriales bacterium]|nr:metallophosphoesterase [Ignavibacteriales bacterium]
MNILNFLLFFLLAMSILAVGYGYVAWRLIVHSPLSQKRKNIAWVLLCALFVLPLFAFILNITRAEGFWFDVFSWVGYVSLGFFSMVFTLSLARDIVFVLHIAYKKVSTWLTKSAEIPVDVERRQFMRQSLDLGIIGAAGILTSYGIYEARRKPAIVEVPIPLNKLPAEFDGFRILQITDIHAGLTVKRPFVETVAGQIEELHPDLIAFTGDLADGTVSYLHKHVEPLAQLKAPFGKFFITGNHEYYSGAESWIEEADRLGYKPLINQHHVVKRGGSSLLLAGVTDFTAGQFIKAQASSAEAAVSGAPSCDVRILLAHQPKSIYEAQPFGFDLQISGHTHGGQFFPWNVFAAVGQPYGDLRFVSGHVRRSQCSN